MLPAVAALERLRHRMLNVTRPIEAMSAAANGIRNLSLWEDLGNQEF